MAARKRKIRHDENTKAKIQASQLVNRLRDHVLGKLELTPTQVAAARILLDKSLPNLASVEARTEVTTSNVIRSPGRAPDASDWARRYKPPATSPNAPAASASPAKATPPIPAPGTDTTQ